MSWFTNSFTTRIREQLESLAETSAMLPYLASDLQPIYPVITTTRKVTLRRFWRRTYVLHA